MRSLPTAQQQILGRQFEASLKLANQSRRVPLLILSREERSASANEIVSEVVTSRRGDVSCPASCPTYGGSVSHGSNLATSTEPLRGSDAISVRELADIRSAGKEYTVLDVREARELDICRLEGALHVGVKQGAGHGAARTFVRLSAPTPGGSTRAAPGGCST
jgi:hypothetical protein